MKSTVIFFALLIAAVSCFPAVTVEPRVNHEVESIPGKFVKFPYSGMTFVNDRYCPNVTFGSEKARMSLSHLASTGANWVAIVVGWYQQTIDTTEIFRVDEPIYKSYFTHISAKDEDLESIIEYAHQIGLKVMLKPHIDLIEDPNGLWRGIIGRDFTAEKWDAWFKSYENYILHYARIAQKHKTAMFSVSCELIEASKQEAHWRALIPKIREIYTGPLVSSANWWALGGGGGEGWDKKWWDLMDIIGVDAYWPMGVCEDPQDCVPPFGECATVADCLVAWQPIIREFEQLQKKWNKKIILSETGSCSGLCKRGRQPSPADRQYQAERYEATILAFMGKPWFEGVFWWSWNTDPATGGHDCDCITPQYKPAEKVLRKYYGAADPNPPPMPDFPAECLCTI